MRIPVLAAAALLLAACETPSNIWYPAVKNDNRPDHFAYCITPGCVKQIWMTFTPAEWAEIAAFFEGTRDAADERDRIARAMSRFEQIAGPKGGTSGDKGGWDWDIGDAPAGQIECFAEAGNTGTALGMMYRAGLLKYHTPLSDTPTMRGLPYGTLGLIHAGATMRENSDGHLWVVDTWYFDNGGPSFVVDRDEWRGGWSPPGA